MTIPTIFLLGATGYVGGEFLILLGRKLPQLPVLALVRHPTAEKITKLHSMHANVSVVEGSLDDLEIVKDQAAKADIVINIASGGHSLSSQGQSTASWIGSNLKNPVAILEGMTEHSARKPGEPPLLIHISGLAVLSDDARGELVKDVKVWSDIGFNLKSCLALCFQLLIAVIDDGLGYLPIMCISMWIYPYVHELWHIFSISR